VWELLVITRNGERHYVSVDDEAAADAELAAAFAAMDDLTPSILNIGGGLIISASEIANIQKAPPGSLYTPPYS
jgi:hypothetical protein